MQIVESSMKVGEGYDVTSRGYLERADVRLAEGTAQALFYAALELRSGIAARMQQYLQARDEVSKRKKQGWRVANLAKDIEQVFRTGDKVVEFSINEESGTPTRGFLLHARDNQTANNG
jgi:hypothetical protein